MDTQVQRFMEGMGGGEGWFEKKNATNEICPTTVHDVSPLC